MHSESLFIFKNDFGYDTLTVTVVSTHLKKDLFRSFAIGSLNSMGLKLNLGLIS